MRIGLEACFCIGDADHVEQLGGSFFGAVLVEISVKVQRFSDLATNREHRVERCHRILEDKADLTATDLSKFLGRKLQQILVSELSGATDDFTRRHRNQAKQ